MSTDPGETVQGKYGKIWRDWWTRNKDKDAFQWLEETMKSALPRQENLRKEVLNQMGKLRDRRAVPGCRPADVVGQGRAIHACGAPHAEQTQRPHQRHAVRRD